MKKPLYTIVDVKKTCNELLQTTFPDITVYGNGVYDGYTRPSFFTEILETSNNLSPYQRSRGYSYKITYFETTHDEKRCLEIYEEILYVFGIDVTIRTDERKIRLLVDRHECGQDADHHRFCGYCADRRKNRDGRHRGILRDRGQKGK